MKIPNIGTRLPDRDTRDWVTSSELLNAVPQITYRQLDYWCRTGLLTPVDEATPGSGWTRRFHEGQVMRARVIAILLDAGVQLPTVRLVVDELVATGRAASGALTFVLHLDQTGDTAA